MMPCLAPPDSSVFLTLNQFLPWVIAVRLAWPSAFDLAAVPFHQNDRPKSFLMPGFHNLILPWPSPKQPSNAPFSALEAGKITPCPMAMVNTVGVSAGN